MISNHYDELRACTQEGQEVVKMTAPARDLVAQLDALQGEATKMTAEQLKHTTLGELLEACGLGT